MIKPNRMMIRTGFAPYWKQSTLDRFGNYHLTTLTSQINFLTKKKGWFLIDHQKTYDSFYFFFIQICLLNSKKNNKKLKNTLNSTFLLSILQSWSLLIILLFWQKLTILRYKIRTPFLSNFFHNHNPFLVSFYKKKAGITKPFFFWSDFSFCVSSSLKKKSFIAKSYEKAWSLWLSYKLQKNKTLNKNLFFVNIFHRSFSHNKKWAFLRRQNTSKSIHRIRKRLLETLFLLYLTETFQKASCCLFALRLIVSRLRILQLRQFSLRGCKVWQNNIRILRLASLIQLFGFSFYMSGKIRRSMRSSVYKIVYGSTSAQRFLQPIDFARFVFVARVGLINANLWVFFS